MRLQTAIAFGFCLLMAAGGNAAGRADSTGPLDEYCRRTFDHPGDLGIAQAQQYFTPRTTYAEAVATVGEMGEEIPATEAGEDAYRWESGKLEMHFRNDRLSKYRFDRQWKNVTREQPRLPAQPERGAKSEEASQAGELRRQYEEFGSLVQAVIKDGSQVTENKLEQDDIKVLQFLAAKLDRAVEAGDWKSAEEVRDKMQVSLQRSHAVADDSKRRLADRQRADEERRHKELVRQRERQHQEEMRLRLPKFDPTQR